MLVVIPVSVRSAWQQVRAAETAKILVADRPFYALFCFGYCFLVSSSEITETYVVEQISLQMNPKQRDGDVNLNIKHNI